LKKFAHQFALHQCACRAWLAPRQTIPLLLVSLIALSGCGLFAAPEEEIGPVVIRTGHPTFTPTVPPTPVPPQPSPTVQNATTAVPAANASVIGGSAKADINGPLVNARSGPGTGFDVLAELARGEEFDIIGVSADGLWWQICCLVSGAQAWVTSEFVDTLGAVDSVPVIGGNTSAQAPSAPAAEATAPQADATATPVPAPVANFDLEIQEQFAETALVRIFLYVYSGSSALEGYSLRVTKDGTDLPVSGTSFGGQPAFTFPFQDPRQRYQNYKVEFPDTPSQGVWQVQLVDDTGATVGPPALFTLTANDPQQELYVRYAQR
jgi:uncharacterized protein YraI